MSLRDLDNAQRLRDRLKPEDLNTEGCIALAEEVLSEASAALSHAAKRYADWPSKKNRQHLNDCKAFFTSDLFAAFSCGVADGEDAMKRIIKEALRGRKLEEVDI